MMSATSKITSAYEFFQILTEENENLRRQEFSMAGVQRGMALNVAIDLWDNFSKAGGWAPGFTLSDAYKRFQNAMVKNRDGAESDAEREGYAWVLDMLTLTGVDFD